MKFSLHQLLEGSGLDTLYLYYFRHKGSHRDEAIDCYCGNNISANERSRLKRRMRYAYIRYGWSFSEFFMMNFESCNHKQRKEFVPDVQRCYFYKIVNPEKYHELFTDKFNTYTQYKQYFKREVCKVVSWEQDGVRLMEFAQKHDRFIIKPIDSSLGLGVQIVANVDDNKAKSLLTNYPNGIIAEELIVQCAELSSLYPLSVNTIRLTTFLQKDGVKIVRPFMRIGRGGKVVDNGGQGGLICALDLGTGKIIAVRDEMGVSYEKHPDTGHELIGFQVPRWEEALSLAKELSQVLPGCPFVGWDLALTNDGWVVVEGNSRGMFIGFQLPTQQGFRTEFKELCKNLPKNS